MISTRSPIARFSTAMAESLPRRQLPCGARGILVCTRLERGRHAFLVERLRDRILTIGTVVSERYFEHREGAQLLVPTVWEGE